jgi:hypothetical protein
MRVFFYKMTSDSGAAPCVAQGILSLAICKPMIRTSAGEGDWVFGFAADSLRKENPLIYVARVTEVARDGRYYADPRYAGRADRIYRRLGDVFERRPDALFHDRPGDLIHDLGRPPAYVRATVLLSTDFRYFGTAGTADYKARYALLGRVIAGLKRGHRLNHRTAVLKQLLALKAAVWKANRRRQIGRPIQSPNANVSQRGGACGTLGSNTPTARAPRSRTRCRI